MVATLLLFVIALAVAQILQAQTTEITGAITDPTGAAIPGVSITVTNIDTGEKHTTTSNERGYYTAPLLDPGQYRMEVRGAGFKPVDRTGIRLQVVQAVRLDFKLEVGSLTERIEVSGEAPLVESESSSLGQVINNRSILEMPLNGRNAWDLVQLAASTVMISGGGNASPIVSIAGSRSSSQGYLIDGANLVQGRQSQSMAELTPMVDAVEEFKVITSNYSAEYGRSNGGVSTAVTKSGTNEFRGLAFEFIRNDAFDARSFFALTKPNLRQNVFGGTLGGPIRKNKTHTNFGIPGTSLGASDFGTITSTGPAGVMQFG
jgi:hypothetical protein